MCPLVNQFKSDDVAAYILLRLRAEKTAKGEKENCFESSRFVAARKKIMSHRSYECHCLCLRKLERQGRDSLMDRMIISSSNNYTREKVVL